MLQWIISPPTGTNFIRTEDAIAVTVVTLHCLLCFGAVFIVEFHIERFCARSKSRDQGQVFGLTKTWKQRLIFDVLGLAVTTHVREAAI